jgi:hypothetical protein
MRRAFGIGAGVLVLMLAMAAPAYSEPSPSPAPAASPDASTGGFDASKLTPAQQEALRLAVIKTSQNPVGNITVVPFQNNFNYGFGPYTRLQYNLNVQPVIPIMLSPSMTLIARTIFPIVNQPSAAPPSVCASPNGCPSTFGIGDTQEQFFFAPKTKPNQLIWGVGPIFQFPTGSPGTLTSGKWAAGPDAVALVMPGSWVMGTLVTQLWSFAGPSNRADVNAFLVQPFINFNLKGGWALSTSPIMTANWSAAGNKWAVPLGGGVSRTFKDGDQLMSLAVSYYTYVTRPLASPQTNLKVVWSLLWPVKRGIDIGQLLKEAQ